MCRVMRYPDLSWGGGSVSTAFPGISNKGTHTDPQVAIMTFVHTGAIHSPHTDF